jgi:hypothetical protein
MSKLRYLFFVLVLVALPMSVSLGQHELVIQDYLTTGHYVNDDILGDTLSTGARKDSARVYVLKRNGVYFLNVMIQNSWPLRIKAENATGRKPVIYSYKNATTGSYPNSIVQPGVNGNLYLKNVVMVNWSEFVPNAIPAELSLQPGNMINLNATGLTVEIDSCILEGYEQGIRIPVATHMLKVTNTVFAQYGNIYRSNFGGGRPIDFRNVSVDSVYIQNCSFMDGYDRVLRHYSSVGALGDVFFDHNTIVNAWGYHGVLALGFVGKKITITNNVFVDANACGNDSTDVVRLAEFGDSGERGPSGAYRITLVNSVPNDTTQWVVKNNFYSVTPTLQTWFTNRGYADIIPLTWHINGKIGADSVTAFRKETITFEKKTHDLVALGTWYNDPLGANRKKANTGFGPQFDFQRPQWQFYADTLKLNYQTTAAAYTGAWGGFPAGDLNWFPARKAAWLLTDVDNSTASVPQLFELSQNYPNPFNPTTDLEYSISKSSNVVLEVFNILGQSVAKLVDEHLVAGTYKTAFDASKLSSGVYLYRLTAGDFVQTRKMVLMK